MIRNIRNGLIFAFIMTILGLAGMEIIRAGFAIHRRVNWWLGEQELVDARIRAIVKPEAMR